MPSVEATRDCVDGYSVPVVLHLALRTIFHRCRGKAMLVTTTLRARVVRVPLLILLQVVPLLSTGVLGLQEFAWRGRYVAFLEELEANELLLVDVALEEKLLNLRLLGKRRIFVLMTLLLNHVVDLVEARVAFAMLSTAVLGSVVVRGEGLVF